MKRLAGLRQAQGIERVIDHLQACLREQQALPDVTALATVAHQSPYHFQRLYRALTGESPGQTLDRLRLLNALQALQQPDASVTDAALAAGYESAQALARRCRQRLDTTPRALRADAALRQQWQQVLLADQWKRALLQVFTNGQCQQVILLNQCLTRCFK